MSNQAFTSPLLQTLQQHQLTSGRQELREAFMTIWLTATLSPDTTEAYNLQQYLNAATDHPLLIELTHLMSLTESSDGMTYRWPVVLINGIWPQTNAGHPVSQQLLDNVAQLSQLIDAVKLPCLELDEIRLWFGFEVIKQATGWPSADVTTLDRYHGLLAWVNCTVAD